MVRIINGEIVSDSDPRVAGAQRRSGGSGGSGGGGGGRGAQGRAGYGRVASILDPPSASSASGEGARGQGAGGGGGEGGARQPGPLDKLAEMIGVHERFVTIPGALGVQENQVPLIYIMIAALVVLFGGLKIAAVMLFAYVVINQKGQGRRQPR
ncbi:unnamed protein product [Pylaiella littoralis]